MKPSSLPAKLLSVALCGAGLLLGGCYEHVVGVKGPATRNYDIQEANIQPGESVWSEDKPRMIDEDRYSGTSLERAKPIPTKTTKKTNGD